MRLDRLPFAVDQLAWTFLDMANDSGRLALMWATTVAARSSSRRAVTVPVPRASEVDEMRASRTR
jgi:hypothetical protein